MVPSACITQDVRSNQTQSAKSSILDAILPILISIVKETVTSRNITSLKNEPGHLVVCGFTVFAEWATLKLRKEGVKNGIEGKAC
jgi:hypothetical protein